MTEFEKRQKIVDTAESFLGVKKGSTGHKQILSIYNGAVMELASAGRYNPAPRTHQMSGGEAWCATFVSVIGLLCGVDNYPCECSCNRQISQLKSMKEWEENDAYIPSPGDILYYDWQDTGKGDNTGVADHVGIIETVGATSFTVIEGNMSGKVGRRTVKINGTYIRGFGKIAFADDPTEKKTEAKPTVADKSYQAKVTPTAGLNVRKGPGTGYAKLGALKCGTAVTILSESDGWGKITYSGKDGWISLQYTKKV